MALRLLLCPPCLAAGLVMSDVCRGGAASPSLHTRPLRPHPDRLPQTSPFSHCINVKGTGLFLKLVLSCVVWGRDRSLEPWPKE